MATIIKRNATHELPGGHSVRGVAFDFQDFTGSAEEYVESVRREATKIVQEAHAEAEQVRKRAEQAGRDAAEAAIDKLLTEKVAGQMATIKPALDRVVHQLTDARGAWLDHWEASALGLAARMAERIVRRELDQRPETTLAWVREALELASGATDITLRLHPEDHANLGDQAEAIAGELSKLSAARVVGDPAVTRGGCVIDTQFGRIDQRVESQVQRLVEDLR